MIPIIIWWLIAQVLGWITLPLAMRFFRWLPDRGYAFSKPLGLLLVSYIVWLGASTGFLRNDLGGILFAILLVTAGSAWLLLRRTSGEPLAGELNRFLREHWRLILAVELLFLVALVSWAGLRAYAPYKIEPAGGEKFMEIAFLNATLNSPQFPPLDPWLSGFAISYYYFGYVMMAVVTRLSAVPPGIAFDLYDALLFAFTLLGAFGVVYNLVRAVMRARAGADHPPAPPSDRQPIAAGLLGALLVGVMGNLGGLLESLHAKGVLPERFWQWIDVPGLASAPVTNSWYPGEVFLWWWRGSRVLSDKDLFGQPVGTQPIDEFPFFSFLLGDNHPHVLALPFVLLCIGLALNLLLRQQRVSSSSASFPSDEGRGEVGRWWNPAAFSLNGDWVLFLFSGLLIGALGFLNTWDMPIYLALVVLAYGLGELLRTQRVDRALLLRALVLAVGLGIACILLYFFFYISFGSQARGILPYLLPPTRLPQYLVMFGPFIFLLVCFLTVFFVQKRGWRLVLRWWLRILLICAGVFLLLLMLAALAALVTQDPTGANPNPTLQRLFNGLDLGPGIRASLQARLRDPWLLLMLTALLGAAIAAGQKVIFRSSLPQPVSLEETGEVLPAPVENAQHVADPLPSGKDRGAARPSELFTFLLIFAGLGLTLLVEFIFLHDSFSARMNTIFKFYYQAWVMLACAGAFALWWLVDRLVKPLGRTLFLAGVIILIAAGMIYPVMAIPTRAGEFRGQPNLDGSSSVAQAHPDDWAAIQWLRQSGLDVDGSVPVIMEAPGASYTYEGRISAFTGYPAVLGWAIHESQWRGNYDEQGKREPDIAAIYTTHDGQLMLDLLRKWQVDYLVLGTSERIYIQKVCAQPGQVCSLGAALRKFDLMLTPVFSQGEITVYAVP